MRFSQRADVAIAENVTTLALGAARDRGPVLDLTVGNPTTAGFTYPSGLLADFSSDDALVYAPDPRGLPETREAIARDEESGAIDPARLVCTASTSEAYSFILKLLCDPGDRILVPAPSYPLFDDLARLEHVGVDRYPLRYDGRWHLLASDLADAITERTRAVFVVHPNNPTGSYLKADEIEALVALGLPVVSDEVFFAYPLDGRVAQKSLLAESRVPTFVLSGLSKRVGLPQAKLGWIHVNGPEADVASTLARLEILADAYLSVSTPVQMAAAALLRRGAEVRRAIAERCRRNLAHLRAMLRHTAIQPLDVEGGWYATLRLPRTRIEEEWSLAFLERGVYVHPGHFFDFDEGPYAVVSLITPSDVFDEGVSRIVQVVHATR